MQQKTLIVVILVMVFAGGFLVGRQFPAHHYVHTAGPWITDTSTGKSHPVTEDPDQYEAETKAEAKRKAASLIDQGLGSSTQATSGAGAQQQTQPSPSSEPQTEQQKSSDYWDQVRKLSGQSPSSSTAKH